jgi:acetyl esterase/lipase
MKNILFSSLIACILAGCPQNSVRMISESREQLDVQYTTQADGTGTTLAIFHPQRPSHSSVVVFFHGGGWLSGDKADLYDFARRLSDNGLIVVIPNYRLAPGSQFPAQIHDAASAVMWTQDHAREWGASENCLFVGGHSAGAHLASLLVTSSSYLPSPPGAIAGVIGVSGVYRIVPQEGGATREFISSVFGNDESAWRRASPIELLPLSSKLRLPPFALLWMQEEHPLTVKESEQFARRLQQQGQLVMTRPLPGSEHTAGLDAISPPLLEALSHACKESN